MASDVNAVYVTDVDVIRVDLPGPGHSVSVLLTPERATRLAAALKVALAQREPAPARTPRKRP
jgi:hypothetical protein